MTNLFMGSSSCYSTHPIWVANCFLLFGKEGVYVYTQLNPISFFYSLLPPLPVTHITVITHKKFIHALGQSYTHYTLIHVTKKDMLMFCDSSHVPVEK